jgi:carboxypeptidase C (cathepsin A)
MAGAPALADTQCGKWNLVTGSPNKDALRKSYSITTPSGSIDYEIEVAYMPIELDVGPTRISPAPNAADNPARSIRGCVFYTAYIAKGSRSGSHRPVTFLYNGGPGSASVWVQIGGFSPKRLDLGPEGLTFAPPFRVQDNPATLLAVSDLVFVDPVNTGFSRPFVPAAVGGQLKPEPAAKSDDPAKIEGESKGDDASRPEDFNGVERDYQSVATFIHNYVQLRGRFASPKYLLGESYGGIRTGKLARFLQGRFGMRLNGLVLVSPYLNGVKESLGTDPQNDGPFVSFLPSLSVTAQYHHALPPDLQQMPTMDLFRAARKFADERYAKALEKGDLLEPGERSALIDELSRFTGLKKELIDEKDLRITSEVFISELLRPQKKNISYLDGRYSLRKIPDTQDDLETDPVLVLLSFPFGEALGALHAELGIKTDMPYNSLAISTSWPRVAATDLFSGYFSVTPDIATVLKTNARARLYVASGIYDLATPVSAVEHAVRHLGLPAAESRERVTCSVFSSGHAVYLDRASNERIGRELVEFYKNTRDPAPRK